MKRTFIRVIGACLIAICALQVTSVHAQNMTFVGDSANYPYWISMMQDPDANFRATQAAFEKYWAKREDYKGNGWKVFKRWEYLNSNRVQPDGKLPKPGMVLVETLSANNLQVNSSNGNWTQIGPVALPSNSTGQPNGLGRVNAVGFHPTDGNILYVGSPSGGLWRTTNGGTSWTVLSASMPSLGVSAVLVHPTQPTIIWIGTGDRDSGDAPGLGVYKSTDNGSTWNASNTGMGNQTVGMLIMHPSNSSIILAATNGGIYKSTDGGANWVLKSSNTNSYKDIRFKPGDPTIVYATEGGRFYRSANTGESWTQITSGVITGSRMVIGVTAANSNYVYLLQTNGAFAGILRSTDSGLNFSTQATTPNIMGYECDGSGTATQAWYDLCIAVDPANANILYTGGINIWKSTNGGASLSINTHWVGNSWSVFCAPSVHADIHSLDFSPVTGTLYTGCDGGIYKTTNGGTNWTDISGGLAIAQVYKIGQSATDPALTINGYQDNGTAVNNSTSFTTVIGGDGMECIIDYTNSNYRYGALYYGDIRRSTGSYYSIIAKNGSNGITESGGWVTPYILHETDPNTMFVGYKNVWRSSNVKAASSSSVTWTKISSGEVSNCTVLEQSPASLDILYVARANQLKRSDNANSASVTWTTCTSPGGYYITDIEAHPTDPDIVYATAGYGVYKSVNKGATWTSISGNLPSIYTNCLVYDKNSNEGLYIGNETSVYFKDATMSNWILFNTGLPYLDVRELEIYYDAAVPANNKLKAATYGQGLWQSDLMTSTTDKTLNLSAVLLQGLYNSNGTMNQASDGSAAQWPAGVADHITVELHNASTYSTIVWSMTDVPLSMTGTATVAVSGTFTSSYYITIKHRNSVETTTAAAVSFAGSTISQSFGALTNVYGGNLVESSDGFFLIHSGDVNLDGIIDLSDLIPVGNLAALASSGYFPEDVNGDGLIDLSDLIIVGNSAALAIGVILP